NRPKGFFRENAVKKVDILFGKRNDRGNEIGIFVFIDIRIVRRQWIVFFLDILTDPHTRPSLCEKPEQRRNDAVRASGRYALKLAIDRFLVKRQSVVYHEQLGLTR